jgi:hypothetical protein
VSDETTTEQQDHGCETDRLAWVRDLDALDPTSLVGSWFHRVVNGELNWQGSIVAQVDKDKYLAHITSAVDMPDNVQLVIDVAEMVFKDEGYEWRFYDTEDKAQLAYIAWLSQERVS